MRIGIRFWIAKGKPVHTAGRRWPLSNCLSILDLLLQSRFLVIVLDFFLLIVYPGRKEKREFGLCRRTALAGMKNYFRVFSKRYNVFITEKRKQEKQGWIICIALCDQLLSIGAKLDWQYKCRRAKSPSFFFFSCSSLFKCSVLYTDQWH